MRLDQFLVRSLPGCSRRTARQAIAAGAVRVNGHPRPKGQFLHSGDTVQVDLAAMDDRLAAQPELALHVLYADEALIAVDKPAGMPSVARRAADRDTLANALLGHFPELRDGGGAAFEAGLVHRLDTATSGVLLAGRTASAWQALRAQFRARTVDKLYLAVVAGRLQGRGAVAVPIAHHPDRPRQMCLCPDAHRARAWRARPAHTGYRPLRRGSGATLVAIRIRTGVRHQIRLHLASIGHPVLGDPLYGDAASASAAPRLLLHAARLGFAHPTDGRRVVVRSALPVDFAAALRDLVHARRTTRAHRTRPG